jgi:Ca-activated chloride channel family protein
VPPGSYNEAVIILLTDGQRTTGPDPLVAARLAADRGVRVYTVGVGTKEGSTIGFEGWTVHVKLDEDTLKAIATMTQAEYFRAGTAADLKKIYQTLNTRIVVETRRTEVTALVVAAAVALLLLSGGLSVWWFHRVL